MTFPRNRLLHSYHRLIPAAIALGLCVIIPTVALAQYVPPDRGLPGRREGGGTRGCWRTDTSAEATRLTAVVPSQNFAYTLDPFPTFFVYVPEGYARNAAMAEFVLSDRQDNELYRATFQTSNTFGVIRLTLPAGANLPPLQVGQDYHWSFALVCNPNDRSADIVVDSWIQRIEPSPELQGAIAQANPQEKPAIYARAGIWYNALNSLAELRSASESDRTGDREWIALLNSVGLDQTVREAPLKPIALEPER